MKKVLFMSAIAAAALASCTSDEYVGQLTGSSGKGEISFGIGADRTTRAAELGGAQAAEKLGKKFIVFGEKFSAAETSAAGQTVFPNYVVKYDAGTAYTTESNSHDWEYVGDWSNYGTTNVPAISGSQTIKYWDYSANGYTFHAFSAAQYDLDNELVVAEKTLTGTAPADKYGKGWSIALKPGASLGDLYIANREEITTERNTDPSHEPNYTSADANKIGNYVNLTFRAAVAKVRFAMYETVPGYDVKIDKVYCEGGFTGYNSTTNFAIDCDYHGIKDDGSTKLNVVYYNDTDVPAKENQPKVTVAGTTEDAVYAVFGPNIHGSANLGYTSNTATYEQADKAYTYVLPNPDNVKDMVLRVDYTLTSTDGTNEKIKVQQASAVVPFPYAKWESNYAYTYIFKISNNTNGSTGNPDDPNDPKGLYPITFDACVVDAVTDVQETITTVADPSITTYAQGVVVTENDEYRGNDLVYIAVRKGTAQANAETLTYGAGNNSQLYRVYNHGTESITEETVANWERNYMTLVPLTSSQAEAPQVVTTVPGANNTTLNISAVRFRAQANETYAYRFKDTDGKYYWKVIKVVDGSKTAVSTPSAYGIVEGTAISTQDGSYTLTVTETATGLPVLGAKNLFKATAGSISDLTVTESNGVYTFKFTNEAILSGAAATLHKVKFEGGSTEYTVGNLVYVFSPASIDVIAGAAATTVTVTAGGDALEGATITDAANLVAATETDASGQFSVATTDLTPAGAYTVTVAGHTLPVTVTNYAFAAPTALTIEHDVANTNTVQLQLQKIVGTAAAANDATVDAASIADDKANLTKAGTGLFTFTPTATTDGGTHTITYKGAKATIYVKNYTINVPASPSVKVSSGSFTATVNVNGTKIAPAKSSWVIKDSSDAVATSSFNITISASNNTTFSSHGAAVGSYTAQYVVGGKVMKSFTFTVVAD